MTTTRATRKTTAEWEEKKETICELYRLRTLVEVIDILCDWHNFIVSKRQLVYRLDLWGIRKYNAGEGAEGGEPNPADGSDQHEDEDGSSAEDSGDDYGNITPPEVGADPIFPSNGDGEAGWPIRKANVLLAMCFHEWSWHIFNDNRFGFGDLRNLTALARAAETVEQCDSTLQVMQPQLLLEYDCSEVLYRYLLTLLVRDTKKDALKSPGLGDPNPGLEVDPEDRKETDLSRAISEKLNEVGDFLVKPDGNVDMIAYILLDNLSLRHQNLLWSPESRELVRSMLYGFNTWSGTGDPAKTSKPVQVLVKCLVWCQQQLQCACSNTSVRTTRLNLALAHSPQQVLWKNHVELFGTLWATLETEHPCTGGQWPWWASQSAEAFNLSHAEVLACVCWIIAESSANRFPADYQAFGPSTSSLFADAWTAAGQTAQLSALELWTKFRKTFVRFNKPTSTDADTDANRNFKTAVLDRFLIFMDDQLWDIALSGAMQSQDGWGNTVMSQCAPQDPIFPVDAAFAQPSLHPRA